VRAITLRRVRRRDQESEMAGICAGSNFGARVRNFARSYGMSAYGSKTDFYGASGPGAKRTFSETSTSAKCCQWPRLQIEEDGSGGEPKPALIIAERRKTRPTNAKPTRLSSAWRPRPRPVRSPARRRHRAPQACP
jgi:hypothetical protein